LRAREAEVLGPFGLVAEQSVLRSWAARARNRVRSGSGARWGPHGNLGQKVKRSPLSTRLEAVLRSWGHEGGGVHLLFLARREKKTTEGEHNLLFTWWSPWSYHMAWFLVHECKEITRPTLPLFS